MPGLERKSLLQSVQMVLPTQPCFPGEHPQLWLPVFPGTLLSFSSQRHFPGISGEVHPNQILDQKNIFPP